MWQDGESRREYTRDEFPGLERLVYTEEGQQPRSISIKNDENSFFLDSSNSQDLRFAFGGGGVTRLQTAEVRRTTGYGNLRTFFTIIRISTRRLYYRSKKGWLVPAGQGGEGMRCVASSGDDLLRKCDRDRAPAKQAEKEQTPAFISSFQLF